MEGFRLGNLLIVIDDDGRLRDVLLLLSDKPQKRRNTCTLCTEDRHVGPSGRKYSVCEKHLTRAREHARMAKGRRGA